MTVSAYLSAGDYATYGLPATLATAQVVRASAVIDTYCHRAIAVTSYIERLRLPSGRNRVLLSYTPTVALAPATIAYTAARGRYGYPRRAASASQVFPAASILEVSSVFGGPPEWETIDVTAITGDPRTGEVWLPAGIYMAQYTEVEITYTAGYATIPDAVKAACAFIIMAYLERAAMAGVKGKGITPPAFDRTLIDRTTGAMLEPYRVRSMR